MGPLSLESNLVSGPPGTVGTGREKAGCKDCGALPKDKLMFAPGGGIGIVGKILLLGGAMRRDPANSTIGRKETHHSGFDYPRLEDSRGEILVGRGGGLLNSFCQRRTTGAACTMKPCV